MNLQHAPYLVNCFITHSMRTRLLWRVRLYIRLVLPNSKAMNNRPRYWTKKSLANSPLGVYGDLFCAFSRDFITLACKTTHLKENPYSLDLGLWRRLTAFRFHLGNKNFNLEKSGSKKLSSVPRGRARFYSLI